MPDAVTVRVQGADRLRRTLKAAGDDLTDLKDVHAKVSRFVADAAQARAPRRTGRLASTIRPARQARRARVSAGRASVPWAGPIHWGWPSRGIAPQPFLSDAAQATESQWVPMYQRDVQKILDRVQGRVMGWQTFRVEVKGEDLMEVTPNALDWRFVQLDPAAPMDGMWQAVHRALVRTGAPVPRDYEGFVEALEGMPEVVDDAGEPDPLARTSPVHSDG